MIPLEEGKIYQVYHTYYKEWMIARYRRTIAAHEERYHNLDMMKLRIVGGEHVRKVPEQAIFSKITPTDNPKIESFGSIKLETRGIQLRPVTEEAIAEIEKLKARAIEAQQAEQAARKELREFCGYHKNL